MLFKFSNKPWPVSVSYHVTQLCDLDCSHCYAVLNTVNKPDPTLKQIFEVIDGLHKRGTLSIRLLGGEPLLRMDLPQIISKVKANGMFCELVTNGTILRKRINQWPEMKKLDSICVSLDGGRTTHDRIRGDGAFDKTMDGIYSLIENGYPVRIHAAFAKESFEAKASPQRFLAEFSKKHDIPFNIATYCPNPTKDQMEDLDNRLSYKQAIKVYQDLLKYKREGVPVSTTEHILEKGIDWFNYTDKYILYGEESVIPKGYRKCQAGIKNCFIDSDGSMYSCIPHWKKGISVYEKGLDEAFDYMLKIRKDVGCQICYNIAQWEYSSFFTFSDPKLLMNMSRNIYRLLSRKNKKKIE